MDLVMKKKPPLRTIPSDELTLVIDGETYHPHEGEWIKVRPKLSVVAFTNALRLYGLTSGGTTFDLKDSLAVAELYDKSVSEVGRAIVEWNWTDDEGKPLGPPSPKVIESLNQQEFWWLLASVLGGEVMAGIIKE